MVKCTQYISTKTLRKIKDAIELKHGFHVSLGMMLSLRPFYVLPPTEREKASCLCKFCLNLWLKFKELMKHLNDQTKKISSMSAYFGHGITCNQNQNGFYQLECISNNCDNCKQLPMFSMDDFDVPDEVSYPQFEVEEYTFMNKAGILKKASRTVRLQKTGSANFYLDSMRKVSCIYYIECKNDTFVWPQILDSPGFIFHLDYSENLSVTPKLEPQDAHFGSKQTSLHCAVVHSAFNSGDVKYVYHLSDVKKHDFAFSM